MGAAMSAARTAQRQRAVMAADSEWERIGEAAAAAGMEKSCYVIHRALAPEFLPPEVIRSPPAPLALGMTVPAASRLLIPPPRRAQRFASGEARCSALRSTAVRDHSANR